MEMDREAALGRLREIHARRDGHDQEADHIMDDKILCDLLTALGYGDVVEAWGEIDKWYA